MSPRDEPWDTTQVQGARLLRSPAAKPTQDPGFRGQLNPGGPGKELFPESCVHPNVQRCSVTPAAQDGVSVMSPLIPNGILGGDPG